MESVSKTVSKEVPVGDSYTLSIFKNEYSPEYWLNIDIDHLITFDFSFSLLITITYYWTL